MKKICLFITVVLMSTYAFAQTAKSVLDKASSSITVKQGVTADFKMTSSQGNVKGNIAVKGRKFHATTPVATIWFDGKTQWTYMKNNDEVNISEPTETQLQAINPYNFINLYKKGYDYTLNKSGKDFIVHLTAVSKEKKIKEMFITIDKKTYHPIQVKLLQNRKWTVFEISNIKQKIIPDDQFKFNVKDFPKAEVIDLR